jgi:hypothetical protein
VSFYIDEYNNKLPHSAFRGQTPDEMYLGAGDEIPLELKAERATAMKDRIRANRRLTCETCDVIETQLMTAQG